MKMCKICKINMVHGIHYENGGYGEFYECPRCHDRFNGRILKVKQNDLKKKKNK